MRSSDNSLLKATILPVQPEDVDHYAPYAVKFIQQALEQTDGETSLESILSDIGTQERQLWIVKDHDRYIAALVTQIYSHNHTNYKIGEITIAGGEDHHLWDHFVDLVGDWFKSQGCISMDIVGRQGWHRLYKNRGFKIKYQILRRHL